MSATGTRLRPKPLSPLGLDGLPNPSGRSRLGCSEGPITFTGELINPLKPLPSRLGRPALESATFVTPSLGLSASIQSSGKLSCQACEHTVSSAIMTKTPHAEHTRRANPDAIEVIARGLLRDRSQILVCQSLKHGYCYLPGGHVEFGEPAAVAL